MEPEFFSLPRYPFSNSTPKATQNKSNSFPFRCFKDLGFCLLEKGADIARAKGPNQARSQLCVSRCGSGPVSGLGKL